MKVTVELREQVPSDIPRTMTFLDVTHLDVNSASDLKLYKGPIDDRQLHAFFPNGSYQYFTREEDDQS